MVMIVGHRGARDLWPENSLRGFRETRALGVDAVEFDVHQTRDGGIIVIHDPTFERTAQASGPVGERSLAEATAIELRDAGGERVPTLEQVLDIHQDSDLELHIEIKTDARGNAYHGLEQRLIDVVRRRRLEAHAVLTCFAPGVLERAHAIAPDIRLLASFDRRSAELLGGIERTLDRFLAIPGLMLAVEKSLLSLTQPLCLDRAGSERLAAWVPNSPEDLAYWLTQPIRAVTTDRPDLALKLRAAS
ncbi:MAG: glycerophosphodiester phosphodiesterase [Alphaproteobacteria bacterium]|nr:glycerophosphodiester phosphodiesterase [Alphaproteobacteria bacterium]MCW5740789.1 glycerophosphodiester phosphodiesterase [Alphaproteobacteria bacterium]